MIIFSKLETLVPLLRLWGEYRCAHVCTWTLYVWQQEKQKAVLNELVGKLTDVCWDKCITSTPGSKFSSSESSCLTNCAQRFMETSSLILRRFQSLQQWRTWGLIIFCFHPLGVGIIFCYFYDISNIMRNTFVFIKKFPGLCLIPPHYEYTSALIFQAEFCLWCLPSSWNCSMSF